MKENVRLRLGQRGGSRYFCLHLCIHIYYQQLLLKYQYWNGFIMTDFSFGNILGLVFLCNKTVKYLYRSLWSLMPLLQSQDIVFPLFLLKL